MEPSNGNQSQCAHQEFSHHAEPHPDAVPSADAIAQAMAQFHSDDAPQDPTIISDPGVYLVGSQVIQFDELQRFLSDEGFPEWDSDAQSAGEYLAETGGRLCYMSFTKPRPGGSEGYLKHVIESGHGSVLEHAVYTFIITGVSRSFSHEFVRHRVGMSPSQLSQRYVDESQCRFVEPAWFREDPEAHDLFMDHARNTRAAYVRMTELMMERVDREYPPDKFPLLTRTDRRKMARQVSRELLPNYTETKLQATFNARALRHLFVLRGSLHADVQIRRVALAMYSKVRLLSPHFFADFSIDTSPEGRDYLHTAHIKV